MTLNLLFLNPNSTASMTELIAAEARSVAAPGTNVFACNPADSPPAIQGPADGEAAVPHVIATLREAQAARPYDAAVIACFDDTGVGSLRDLFNLPVIGIGQAAFHLAMLRARRFSVVTTLPVSVPVIEQNLIDYGFASRCAHVYAAGVGVLELERDPEVAFERIALRVEQVCDEDRSTAVVLGCAGMADVASRLEQLYGMPVIDGVKAAVGLAEAVVRMTRAEATPA